MKRAACLLADSSIPPMKIVNQKFRIPVYNETNDDGKICRVLSASSNKERRIARRCLWKR
jgi:hypothetical protein